MTVASAFVAFCDGGWRTWNDGGDQYDVSVYDLE